MTGAACLWTCILGAWTLRTQTSGFRPLVPSQLAPGAGRVHSVPARGTQGARSPWAQHV